MGSISASGPLKLIQVALFALVGADSGCSPPICLSWQWEHHGLFSPMYTGEDAIHPDERSGVCAHWSNGIQIFAKGIVLPPSVGGGWE